ncbi:hypothetical protein FOB63_002426 [Clavispora lusitaniae]|uniref:Uncharacterized protein n=1 Tax=Clavispora lusitaniae TaxID=36911 RepID=A0AA91T3Z6_CLALS|nr:hypothetical protein FOB63_002426 [Clavispora lusitaniae]OVF10893.1 hypothetical protein A9F13_01g03278 [Clavispora lusitaniae]
MSVARYMPKNYSGNRFGTSPRRSVASTVSDGPSSVKLNETQENLQELERSDQIAFSILQSVHKRDGMKMAWEL